MNDDEFPILARDVPGHHMTIHAHYDLFGEISEFVFYCRDCDDEQVAEIKILDTLEAMTWLTIYAEEHTNQ